MENQGQTFTRLYHQALVNPKEVSAEDFALLLSRYPYSQPLHFAFERRKFLCGELTKLGSRAILLASSPNWLHDYVQLPVQNIPFIPSNDDDLLVADLTSPLASGHEDRHEPIDAPTEHPEVGGSSSKEEFEPSNDVAEANAPIITKSSEEASLSQIAKDGETDEELSNELPSDVEVAVMDFTSEADVETADAPEDNPSTEGVVIPPIAAMDEAVFDTSSDTSSVEQVVDSNLTDDLSQDEAEPAVEEEAENAFVGTANNHEKDEEQQIEANQQDARKEDVKLENLQDLTTEEESAALDNLVHEGIGGGDYFALHTKEIRWETNVGLSGHNETDRNPRIVSEPVKQQGEEDVSVYNDDLMPYSFRWWLHKTRLEYADTYQPFASPYLPTNKKSSFDPEAFDKVVLDQQIRENIIHLQSPEDKLSDEVKQRAVTYNRVDKTTEVIERFIREEPQIQPPPADQLTMENKARKSSEEQFNLVTETLANIYASQGMYVKAIEVYKKLILRFPEKKSYFATQIKGLEEKLY